MFQLQGIKQETSNRCFASESSQHGLRVEQHAQLDSNCSELPLVSVIIPAYNAADYVRATLDSVIAQTYRNLEILVVDDGSQDQTPEIVRQYAECDRRITLLQQENAGVAAARNLAIHKSTGAFIAPIDADDIWYSTKIEKQVRCMMASDPSVGLVYTWSVDINADGKLTGRASHFNLTGNVLTALIYCNFLGNASVPLIRRECFDKVGYYDPNLRAQGAQGCEDRDLYLRIAEHYHYQVVPEFLMGYRKAIGTMSCNYQAMAKSHLLVLQNLKKRRPDIPAQYYRWSTGNFYMYLAIQARRSGHYNSNLVWLFKAVTHDGVHLLKGDTYFMAIKSLLNLLAKPIASLLWPDRLSWLQFKHEIMPSSRSLTLSDMQNRVNTFQHPPRQLYARIRSTRWMQVVQPQQLSQPSSYRQHV